MSCLIVINGGLGKQVMATSFMSELRAKYGSVYVVSPYLDVFLACPSVENCYLPGNPEIKKYILDPNCVLITTDPYDHPSFIRRERHLLDVWREICFLDYTSDDVDSHYAELEPARVPFLMDNYSKLTSQVKSPFILLQLTGGQSCLQLNNQYNARQEGIKRNYPYATELVRLLRAKFPNVTLISYTLPTEPLPDGVLRFDAHYLHYRLLAERAQAIICIDSSLQHLATGVNDNINVIWGETRPQHFGYSCNHNFAKPLDDWSPYFRPLGAQNSNVKFPSPEEIVSQITL